MLHYFFDFFQLDKTFSTIYNLFNYISVRSALAVIFSLFVTIYFGRYIIPYLKRKLVSDKIRKLGLEGELSKQGTPTMGGVIILLGILIPTLILCQLNNIYVQILMLTSIWMAVIGFVDDYIKVFKNDKKGLGARFKIIGQVSLGLIVSLVILFHPKIVIQEHVSHQSSSNFETQSLGFKNNGVPP